MKMKLTRILAASALALTVGLGGLAYTACSGQESNNNNTTQDGGTNTNTNTTPQDGGAQDSGPTSKPNGG